MKYWERSSFHKLSRKTFKSLKALEDPFICYVSDDGKNIIIYYDESFNTGVMIGDDFE